jgi:arylsulfatase A-like enzyme/Tfp pilus assembly protein PilF
MFFPWGPAEAGPTFMAFVRAVVVLLLSFAVLDCSKSESRDTFANAPVIIISVDTLRADHLPAYGYKAIATPVIDALRRDSVLFENAYSHVPLTLPSHVSILTGQLPYQTNVRNNIGYRFDGNRHQSLPRMLKGLGYATGAAVSAYVLRGEAGLRPLFDFYDDDVSGGSGAGAGEVWRNGDATVAVANRWIQSRSAGPFFFMLHLFEPHWPYEGGYDKEIVRSDAIVGRFIDQLKQSGIYDRAIIIFLSDHGEGLGDHGESEHGVFLYREAIHVPLMIKFPGNVDAGRTRSEPVQLIDVAPTVLAALGAGSTPSLSGRSLLLPVTDHRRIYSETMLPRIHFGWSDLRSVVDAKHQYIEAPRGELFDLAEDPQERNNVASDQRRLVSEMRAALALHASTFAAPFAIDPEEAEKLAALGYIGQVRTDDGAVLPDPKDHIAELEKLKTAAARERSGDLRSAALLYEDIIRANPRFADAWLRLGALMDRVGQSSRAIDAYRNAINTSPALAADAALAAAGVYLRTGQLQEAAAHAQLAASKHPAASHHLLGRVALSRRDFNTAEREARLAMGEPLYQAPGSILLARIRIEQGRLNDAVDVLANAGTSQPARDLALTRGDALARLNRVEEAVAAFEEEISAFPHNTEAYTRLALLYAATGRAAGSEEALQRMVRANPQSAGLAAQVRRTLREP